MTEAADEKGLEYILVTNHGPNASIPSKLDSVAFDTQRAEIEEINPNDKLDVTVLQGMEAEITEEGLEIPANWLEACDLVVAGMHSTPPIQLIGLVGCLRTIPSIFSHISPID